MKRKNRDREIRASGDLLGEEHQANFEIVTLERKITRLSIRTNLNDLVIELTHRLHSPTRQLPSQRAQILHPVTLQLRLIQPFRLKISERAETGEILEG